MSNQKMKKVLFILLSLFFVTTASAGVRMLGDSGSGGSARRGSGVSFKSQPTSTYKATSGREWCMEKGYTQTSCEGGGVIVTCPRNSHYVHCCPPKYRFTKEFCESRGYIPSEDDCMGYYRCMVPTPAPSQVGK
ncbi:MAG: hypothetical protein IJ660_06330 [Alphaproteobacteria bacterium]|nr:hypothetical protein [Alphaproteobacteria bacterium]